MSSREAVLTLPPLPAGQDLVSTTDTLLSGVHFPPHTAVEDLAHKALAVNLSDLAAMGARPLGVQVQVHDSRDPAEWSTAVCAALGERARALSLACGIGAARLGARGLSVLALGHVASQQALTRSGARAGDEIWISGTLGEAGAGLVLRMNPEDGSGATGSELHRTLCDRLQRPEPRLALGQALVGVAHSAIDVSDGLVGDLGHILERSRVAAELWLEALPLSDALLAYAGPQRARELALCAGDDYELCFTAPATAHARVLAAASCSATTVRVIGRIQEGSGLRLLHADGTPEPVPQAYQHFREHGQ